MLKLLETTRKMGLNIDGRKITCVTPSNFSPFTFLPKDSWPCIFFLSPFSSHFYFSPFFSSFWHHFFLFFFSLFFLTLYLLCSWLLKSWLIKLSSLTFLLTTITRSLSERMREKNEWKKREQVIQGSHMVSGTRCPALLFCISVTDFSKVVWLQACEDCSAECVVLRIGNKNGFPL